MRTGGGRADLARGLAPQALRAVGLAKRQKGAAAASTGECDDPSWHHAYARNASKMHKLLKSLPEEHDPLECKTCALVSSAGSLLGSGHGEAIDANE